MTRYRYGAVSRAPELYLTDINGAIKEDVTDAIRGGEVALDTNRAIAMSFTGDSRHRDLARPFVDFLAPFLTVTYSDGYSVREPLGLYAFAPMDRTELEGSTIAAIDGRDLSWLLTVDHYDQGYTAAAATNPIEAVRAIIDTIGARHSIPSTTKTLAAAVSFKAGTSKLEVCNKLLGAAGYYALYASRDGRLTSRPWRRLASDEPDTRYATDGTSRSKIVRSITITPKREGIYNKVIVIRDDPNQAPLVATATNTSPQSPISTTSLGYTITRPPISDPYLIDQATADALASRLLEEASAIYTRMQVFITPDPGRGAHEIVELAIANSAGATIAEGNWWLSGWALPFDRGGAMTLELNKLLPFEAL